MTQPTIQTQPSPIVSPTAPIVQPLQPQPNPSIIYLPAPTAPQGDLLTFLVVVALTMLAKVLTDHPQPTK